MFADRKGVNAGLIVRVDKPGVGADRFIGYEVSLNAGRQRLLLARHRNNFEPIKDVPCEVPVGRWIPLEVRLSGSVIEIFVDGKSVLRHDDGEQALPAGSRRTARLAARGELSQPVGEDRRGSRAHRVQTGGRRCRKSAACGGPFAGAPPRASFALSSERPFAGTQSQRVTFGSGEGEWGVENQGLNRWGMNFVEGRAYEGYVWVRADKPATLFASLESRDGTRRPTPRPS